MTEARRNPPAGATPPAPPSAPPSPTSEQTPNWFICPQCQLTKFGTANPQCFATGEPQILECHGLASDGPPFGCGWRGSWDDVLKAWAKREVLLEFSESLANKFDRAFPMLGTAIREYATEYGVNVEQCKTRPIEPATEGSETHGTARCPICKSATEKLPASSRLAPGSYCVTCDSVARPSADNPAVIFTRESLLD